LNAFVGVSMSIPTAMGANLASTYYWHWYTITCTDPLCYAAILVLSPGSWLQKIVSFKTFLDKNCGGLSTSVVCIAWKGGLALSENVIKYWAENGIVGGIAQFVTDGAQWLRTKFLDNAKKVGEKLGQSVDVMRALVGDVRPQNLAAIRMPEGTGVYFKFKDCSELEGISDLYWTCGVRANSGADTEEIINTNVGEIKNGRLWWDYKADQTQTGFGHFWAGETSRTCVHCYANQQNRLGHGFSLGIDDTYEDVTIGSCGPSKNEWQSISVQGKSGNATSFTTVPKGLPQYDSINCS